MKILYLALLGSILAVSGHKLNDKKSALSKVESLLEDKYLSDKHRQLKPSMKGLTKKLFKTAVYGKDSNKEEDNPIGDFIFGCILIGFAIPMVWMNERKQVKIFKLIEKARKACIPDVPASEVSQNDNFKLVHSSAHTSTEGPTHDETFGAAVGESMKIRRVIEMYQWKETKHEKEDERTTYTYKQCWATHRVESSGYNS
jgi:hypothetical protein